MGKKRCFRIVEEKHAEYSIYVKQGYVYNPIQRLRVLGQCGVDVFPNIIGVKLRKIRRSYESL